jgi:phosphoribosylformylglycinamidine synthase
MAKVEVSLKPNCVDPKAQQLLRSIRNFLDIQAKSLSITRVYNIHKAVPTGYETLFYDPIIETLSPKNSGEWTVEVKFKPGVTDNAGKIAQLTLEDFVGEPFKPGEYVSSATKYIFSGDLAFKDVERIAVELLANPLIEDIAISDAACCHRQQERCCGTQQPTISNVVLNDCEIIPINISDAELEQLSSQRCLALNLEEMKTIQKYYAARGEDPTDVELEVFAQTWSEHCKHKIFQAEIRYTENGKTETIPGLFSTYIKKATEEIGKNIDWLVSVFTDNAGIIRFNNDYNVAFKVETHNSPSALDPYGGALTGILGVNRDIMGAGNGARLVANTDVLCFAPPDYEGRIPERLQHPRRVLEGVCRGIEHGGNKSGVPTVNGSVVFDERYLGKPLVYCGSIGIMPAEIDGYPTHIKEILPGDLIVIVGGRTGKDGIHGATFSSEALSVSSPSTAVQIGDPFTQKKVHDFLLEARDAGLYRTLTDNGAGGFSSSVGELANLSGGCEIHLERALLKQSNLRPWEILVSESQERMTLAVSPNKLEALSDLAQQHEVEIYALGTFTNSGKFHAIFHGKTVALISLEFLHHGLPKMKLEAEWTDKKFTPCKIPKSSDYTQDLLDLLSRDNIRSKEPIVRQYDHEVQGGSVLKPFVGIENDGPSDAAIIWPHELMSQRAGIVVGHGICPRYSEYDTFSMTACAIDEAIRSCVAVGADPDQIAILDNFCWPDPIGDSHKMAQLVRANKALYFYSKAFATPLISGKDSMKNDYKMDNIKISVPPTLLISAIGKIPEITSAVSMDVKRSGDYIYLLGTTKNELGGSEYTAMKHISGGVPPSVDAVEAKKLYRLLHQAIRKDLIASCHDCSDGGIAVALAESAFAGGLGMDISIDDAESLFSETASRFIVTVHPHNVDHFELTVPAQHIGFVREDNIFKISSLINTDINSLKKAWQKW